MIFRAIFWVGLVALLMPREPDLGLGRPGARISPSFFMNAMAGSGLPSPGPVCDRPAQGCAGGLAFLDSFQDSALRGLAQVKADIDADRKARAARAL